METLTVDDRAPQRATPADEPVVGLSGRGRMVVGGTDSWTVDLDGRWIGWVGDDQEWRGAGYGGRRWWACWRETGDEHARQFLAGYRSQAEAVEALVAVVRRGAR